MAVSGVARPQGGQPAAIFYPLVHPMPYAYASENSQSPTFKSVIPFVHKLVVGTDVENADKHLSDFFTDEG
jgi:hypothetical protein